MEIPSELLDLYHEGIDAIINAYGRSCKLYYLPTRVECPNCVLDTFNNTSAGVYKTGGPIEFSDGLCPYCNNIGYIDEQNTESVTMLRFWSPSEWTPYGRLVIPAGGIQTKGYMSDFPKLDQCIRMETVELNGYKTFTFEKLGVPVPHGLSSRWVITNWKQI